MRDREAWFKDPELRQRIKTLEELDAHTRACKESAIRHMCEELVQYLHSEGVPRDRIADIAAKAAVKAYPLIDKIYDADAALVERTLKGSRSH